MLKLVLLDRNFALNSDATRNTSEPEHVKMVREKKNKKKNRECHNEKPQPFPDCNGRGNRQNQTIANRTNVRKALRKALSSPSEVIAMLKGLKNTRTKYHKARLKINCLVDVSTII